MLATTWNQKKVFLFIVLAGFFITNALLGEFIGVKIFSLEETLGINPLNWNLFGKAGTLDFSAGVLPWPIVFIFTDIINEYYGRKGVQRLSYLTIFLIIYAFIIIFGVINLAPASWWIESYKIRGVDDMQVAFQGVFGQSLYIIFGSVIAFGIGQLLDVLVFRKLKRITGEKHLWLRATGSTAVSQFVDSFVVLYIGLVIPLNWDMSLFLAVGTLNYTYKILSAFALTPVIYFIHYAIERYLGHDLAAEMKAQAMN